MASRRRYGVMVLVAGVLASVIASVLASGGVAGYHLSAPSETILPGVFIAGVDVGGLTPEQAKERVRLHLEARLNSPVTFSYSTNRWSVRPKELGAEVRLDEAIEAAASIGRYSSQIDRVRERLWLARNGLSVPVEVSVDERAFEAWLDAIDRSVRQAPESARLEPTLEGGVRIIPSKSGFRLDRSGLLERFKAKALDTVSRNVWLTLVPVEAEFTTEDARALEIRRPIAVYTTRFDPAERNRTHNIHIAADAINGLILAPGEEFSFNKIVGPRIEEAGFKEAPVVIDGELVPDIGGGICQVSSTLYNAVLLADLQVTRRIAHSIPSTYVPLGQDATVAYDYIDFRFRNDTGSPVMIGAFVRGSELIIAIYGNEPPFRSARLESELVRVLPREEVTLYTKELAPGERRIVKEGREGYQVNVWRVAVTHDGRAVRELVSQTLYKPWQRVIWHGGEGSADRSLEPLLR